MSASDEKKTYQLVKAYIRQRPFTKDELELRSPSVIKKMSSREIILKVGLSEKKYTFDQVFGPEASQAEIYKIVVCPMIDYIISGYNCTVFAYGQTGTGKTHTMIGTDIGANTDFDEDPSVGMIPRAASHLFCQLANLKGRIEYTVTVSFIEIYNEEVRNLLAHDDTPLRVYDDPDNRGSICIKGLMEKTVCNTNEVYEFLQIGIRERQTAQTNLNRHSSRSHTIFTLVVHTKEMTADGEEIVKTGKLHLTDLAGSENIGRSGATDMRAREAGTINKSLLTLGKVIKSLAQKMQHIPYRDSKLTRILQDSLGGKTKTCMIATFSPCVSAVDETVSTLDYAYVARSVANCPQVNVNINQVNVLNDLKRLIHNLRQELTAARTGEGFYVTKESYDQMRTDVDKYHQRVTDLVKEIQHLEEYKSFKEQQFKSVNDSFLKTNSYLEQIKKELEEKRLKEKQNKCLIHYLNGRDQELNNTADMLLKICKTATKHEQIYHEKYQNLCNLTSNNANVANSMHSTSINSLKTIQKSSENFVTQQEACIQEITKMVSFLKSNHFENLEQLTEFLLVLQMMMTNFSLIFDKIVQSDEGHYDVKDIYSFMDTIFSNSLQFEKDVEVTESINSLKHYLVEKSTELKSKLEDCLKLIKKEWDDEQEYFVTNANLLDDMYKFVVEKHTNMMDQIQHNKELTNTFQRYLLKCEEDEEKLETEILSFCKESEKVLALLRSYQSRRPMSNVKEALVNFNRCRDETVRTYLHMVDNTTGVVEDSEACCKEDIMSGKDKVKQYFSGFINTIENNLERYNEETKNSICNVAKQLEMITEKIHKSTSEYSGSLEKSVELISDSTSTHSCDIKKFIQSSSEQIEGLKNNTISTAHVGDTPVKGTYDYPKTIAKRLPNEVLLQQLMSDCTP